MKNSSIINHNSTLYKEFIDKTGKNRSSKEEKWKEREKIESSESVLSELKRR